MATTKEKKKLAELEEKLEVLAEDKAQRDAIEKEDPLERQARLTREQQVAEIWRNLEELGGKQFDQKGGVVHEGTQIKLPADPFMSIRQGREHLERVEADEEREVRKSKTFMYRPWDGAWCMWNVMQTQFGAAVHRGQIRFSFFGQMEEPPQLITVNSGVNETTVVPWGNFTIPSLENTIFSTDTEEHADYGLLFRLVAAGPKKYEARIDGLFLAIEKELKERSLYRGKAFDGQETPEFVDVWSVDPEKVVYSSEVLADLEAHVWSQLRYPEGCERLGIAKKRAVLITGTFGVGKTLAAMLTGQEALKGGYTFIRARPGRDKLANVLKTARLYQPAVVFYEDLDTVATADQDRPTISRLLDDFDGVDAKGTEILAVLTTNYPERIHAGMIRPGRLDKVIKIGDLDMQGVEKLIKVHIPVDALEPTIDWERVYEASTGYKPAFIAAVADSAKRYLLVRTLGEEMDELIGTEDLVSAALGLRAQYEMQQEAKDTQVLESLDEALGRRLREAIEQSLNPGLLKGENQYALNNLLDNYS